MTPQPFEQIKKINEFWQEFRSARELAKVLEYGDYRNFLTVLEKARIACKQSHQAVNDHFVDVNDMIKLAKWAKRQVEDVQLSRYACYLIIQNADSRKEIVALGQTYFAIQTRRQEVADDFLEDRKRVVMRDELTYRNKKLFKTAKKSWVQDYANFYDYGYLGLYGMRKHQIAEKKGLKNKDNILDYMDGEELGANIFRATQADAKIKRESIIGQEKASKAHYEVGKEVRTAIKKIGGTMPEELPIKENIKGVKKRINQQGKYGKLG